MTKSRHEQHELLFDQFVKELFVDPELPAPIVLKDSLHKPHPKRQRFLDNPNNRKGKNEPKNEMPPLQRKSP